MYCVCCTVFIVSLLAYCLLFGFSARRVCARLILILIIMIFMIMMILIINMLIIFISPGHRSVFWIILSDTV